MQKAFLLSLPPSKTPNIHHNFDRSNMANFDPFRKMDVVSHRIFTSAAYADSSSPVRCECRVSHTSVRWLLRRGQFSPFSSRTSPAVAPERIDDIWVDNHTRATAKVVGRVELFRR